MEVKFLADDIYNDYLNAYKLVKYYNNFVENEYCLQCPKKALYYIPVNIGKDRKIFVHGKCCSLKCILRFLLFTEDVTYNHSNQIIFGYVIPFILNVENFGDYD